MNRFEQIIQILDDAVGGPDSSVGFHGAFWRNRTRDEFIGHSVFGFPLIELGNPGGSNLVKALKGDAPFDGSVFPLMPAGARPPVPGDEIAVIEQWISDNCPEDDVATVDIGVESTGDVAADQTYNDYWRDFDNWSLHQRTPDVDAAIGRFFMVVPQWRSFAAGTGSETVWQSAVEQSENRGAIAVLAQRQAQTVVGHFGDPVQLLKLLDCYQKFGADSLAPDPQRPSEPRHNMNGQRMWFFWASFADACLRLGIEPTFWRGHMRAILLGLLNDGVFRGRFTVSGFAATDEGRAAMLAFVQTVVDSDLQEEFARRYRESGLADIA